MKKCRDYTNDASYKKQWNLLGVFISKKQGGGCPTGQRGAPGRADRAAGAPVAHEMVGDPRGQGAGERTWQSI